MSTLHLFVLLQGLLVLAASSHAATVRWQHTGGANYSVEVSNLEPSLLSTLKNSPSDGSAILSVRTGSKPSADSPAVSGTFEVQENKLRFTPAFALQPRVVYTATLQQPGRQAQTAVLKTPSGPWHPPTRVAAVYPSASVVPENLLKFYLYFSQPMSRGNTYERIKLFNENGKEVDLPFLDISEELWDPEMKRLTLFIDPGRIKRGVKPLEEIGPVLESGKKFTLTIDRGWLDAYGKPLASGFKKSFTVGPTDRSPLDIKNWKIVRPKPGSRNPVKLIFDKPMDHALALRMIQVFDGKGRPLQGETFLGKEDREWSFYPQGEWQRSRYQISIRTTIEDLAGNNIGKAFEVDVFDTVQQHLTSDTVRIPFGFAF